MKNPFNATTSLNMRKRERKKKEEEEGFQAIWLSCNWFHFDQLSREKIYNWISFYLIDEVNEKRRKKPVETWTNKQSCMGSSNTFWLHNEFRNFVEIMFLSISEICLKRTMKMYSLVSYSFLFSARRHKTH